MNALKEAMKTTLYNYLTKRDEIEDDEVIVDFHEDEVTEGYCETCTYTEEVIMVKIQNVESGDIRDHIAYVSFADFIDMAFEEANGA